MNAISFDSSFVSKKSRLNCLEQPT